MANGTGNLNSPHSQMPLHTRSASTRPGRAAAAICDFVRSAVIILACLVIAAVTGYHDYLANWPEGRRAFVSDLNSIEPGMSQAQVEEIMKPYMTGTGRPGMGRSGVFRWCDEDGRWDADLGIVRFRGGKVVDVRFLRD